jgi:hypothetical protein
VCEDRTYELRAVQKPGPGRLRATIRVRGEQGRFVADEDQVMGMREARGSKVGFRGSKSPAWEAAVPLARFSIQEPRLCW